MISPGSQPKYRARPPVRTTYVPESDEEVAIEIKKKEVERLKAEAKIDKQLSDLKKREQALYRSGGAVAVTNWWKMMGWTTASGAPVCR